MPAFRIGDRVRYVGRTVTVVPAGTEGEVVKMAYAGDQDLYGVKFPNAEEFPFWPAELERVR